MSHKTHRPILILAFIYLASFNYVSCSGTTTTVSLDELSPEELAKVKKINENFCGFNEPKVQNDCWKLSTEKSDCCVISMGGRSACLPQSAKSFKDKSAEFTIDNVKASIICTQDAFNRMSTNSKFFETSYCGAGSAPESKVSCTPRTGETKCCYLESKARMTNGNPKVLRTCLSTDVSFNNTVVAQTLFAGSNTTLSCYEDGGFKDYRITTASSRFLSFALGIFSFISALFI